MGRNEEPCFLGYDYTFMQAGMKAATFQRNVLLAPGQSKISSSTVLWQEACTKLWYPPANLHCTLSQKHRLFTRTASTASNLVADNVFACTVCILKAREKIVSLTPHRRSYYIGSFFHLKFVSCCLLARLPYQHSSLSRSPTTIGEIKALSAKRWDK